MNEGASESRMMEAAEAAIEVLRKEVRVATKAAQWRTRWVWVLTGVTVMLVASCIVLAISVYNQSQLTNTVRGGAIASCQSGNEARATNQKIWDEFLSILITDPTNAKTREDLISEVHKLGLSVADTQALTDIIDANWSPNPDNLKIAEAFEAYIASHEKQQACTAIYSR